MPVLTNPKHERFAQELAKGVSQVEAYATAGYAPNDGHAARLAGNGRIQARLAELQERAANKAVVTVANLTERLLAIAEKGEASTEAPMLSVGRAAIMDVAKLNGLVIDKSVTAQTSLEDMLDGLGTSEGPAPTDASATSH